MEPRPTKTTPPVPGAGTGEPPREHGPVVVLEPDHDSAGALQAQLSACGFEWIALVHDVADARRIVAAAPVRLALLAVDRRAPEVLAMAQDLVVANIPLILVSATGRPLVFPGLPERLTVLARGCSRDALVAACEAELDASRRQR